MKLYIMPKHTKKEFSIACGIKTKDLSNYIARGKVVLTGDKIDTDLEINKYFLEKRKEYNANKSKPETTVAVPNPEQKLNDRVAEKTIKEKQAEFSFPKEHPPITRNFQLDEQIKEQSLEKERINTALQKAKLEKISGDSIPTELVKNLFVHHSKSITIAFQNGADNLLMKIAKKKGLERTEMAELRIDLIEIINTAVNDSIEESKKTVRHMIAEYSQKKEVGERE